MFAGVVFQLNNLGLGFSLCTYPREKCQIATTGLLEENQTNGLTEM